MAYEIPCFKIGTLLAAADLSAKQYYCVGVDSNGKVALSGVGAVGIGILQNNPEAAQEAEVMVFGVSMGVASAAIAKGARVTSDSAGKLKTAVLGKVDTSDGGAAADPVIGSHVYGIALEEATADGQIISVLLLHMGAVPTTAA